MGRVVGFEMSSQNPELAIEFYRSVFGWKAGSENYEYWPIETGRAEPGINGGIDRGPVDFPHGTRVLIEVEDLDETIANAVEKGARIVREKMEFDDFYLAYLIDPTGIGIGIQQKKSRT